MGYLTTFTVYNDNCDQIKEKPKEFANAIYNACCNTSITYRSNVFNGVVIPQKTRHADDMTIYAHAGNTVCEINSNSDITKDIMMNSPTFFNELLKYMEYNLNELKKQFNEIKK